jgi:hypothetical protein
MDCPGLDLQCLALRQAAKKVGSIDAERMASHLIYRCYGIFLNRRIIKRNLRYIDMFEQSVADQVRIWWVLLCSKHP